MIINIITNIEKKSVIIGLPTKVIITLVII